MVDVNTAQVLASDAQQALFREWAEGTEFELKINASPKQQFNVLAKLLHWVGGEEPWNAHWKECFGEEYIWRAGSSVTPTPSTTRSDKDTQDVVRPSSSNATLTLSDDGGSVSGGSVDGDKIWITFEGFKPNPTAGFNCEFYRLARHMRRKWSDEDRREWRVKIFNADWEHHVGSDIGNLAHWKEFCHLCGITPIPETIPGCMEVLSEIFVNIYDLLDSKRKGSAVNVFDTFDELRDYTVPKRQYPINEAKANTFLPIFLKVFFPERNK